jgi:hypothetical protein
MKEHRSQGQRGFWEICIHYYYNYVMKRQQRPEVVFDNYDVRKSQEKYGICITCVSLTGFPGPPSTPPPLNIPPPPPNIPPSTPLFNMCGEGCVKKKN